MCKATVVLTAFALLTTPLHAQPVDCTPVPCCCLEPPPPAPPQPTLILPALPLISALDQERAEGEREAKIGVGIGIGIFTVGAAIATAHVFATRTPESVYGFAPVAGPMANVFLTNDGGWASALLFSTWLEAAGILVAAVSAAYISPAARTNDLKLGLSSDGKSGSIGIRGRF